MRGSSWTGLGWPAQAILRLGGSLYETGQEQGYAYSPTTAIISLLAVMRDGASSEIAVIGNDGLLGVAIFLGGESMTNRAVVQSAGFAYRMAEAELKEEFKKGEAFQRLLLRFAPALIAQMTQTSA